MMKDRAAIDEIEHFRPAQLRGGHESDARFLAVPPGDFDAHGRLIGADDAVGTRKLRQQNRRRACPATEVENRARSFARRDDAVAKPLDSASSIVVLVL